MLPKIFYYDFHIGFAAQGPSAWLPLRVKLAALTYEDALNRAIQLGYDASEIMRMECFTVKAKNGSTVVQYKNLSFRDTDALLEGIRQHLRVTFASEPEFRETQPVKEFRRKAGRPRKQ